MRASLLPVLGAALLWGAPALATDSSAPITHRGLVYATVAGKPLDLDLYLPPASAQPAPLLVWIHGGSWRVGNRDFPDAGQFTAAGFALASIDYRLTSTARFPAQIFDCKAAVRWLRANAGKYGLDANRIVAMGSSAGGHLAALLGTTADNPAYEGNEGVTGVSSQVQGVCDFSGPTDLLKIREEHLRMPAYHGNAVNDLLGGDPERKPQMAQMASPALQVTKAACPFFIAHGADDELVPVAQSQELDAALKKAGVSSTLRVVPDAGHYIAVPMVYAEALATVREWTRGT